MFTIPRAASCKKSIRKNNSMRKNKSTRKHILYLKMCFLVDLFFLIELFFLSIDFYMKLPIVATYFSSSLTGLVALCLKLSKEKK